MRSNMEGWGAPDRYSPRAAATDYPAIREGGDMAERVNWTRQYRGHGDGLGRRHSGTDHTGRVAPSYGAMSQAVCVGLTPARPR
jgi:hypothetical protein